jgi:hypothetical protein
MNQPSGSRKRTRSQTEPMEELPVTKRTLGTILERPKIDEADARMDALVLKVAHDEPSTLSLATLLLATIVSTSEGKLQSEFSHVPVAYGLLQEHPRLLIQLQDAWKKKSFKEIRDLGA